MSAVVSVASPVRLGGEQEQETTTGNSHRAFLCGVDNLVLAETQSCDSCRGAFDHIEI